MRLTESVRQRVFRVWERILDHYGPSAYHAASPRLVLQSSPRLWLFGWWWGPPPEVGLNLAACESWDDVAGTLIDEYQHHLQDPEDWSPGYEKAAAAVAARDAHLFAATP